MLLPMLRAVNKMLDCHIEIGEGADNIAEVNTSVKCAKTILDEIIANLKENPDIIQVPITAVIETQNPVFKTKPGEKPVLETKPHREPVPTVEAKDEWMITIDENRGLKIVDFPMDGMVELDGKKMKYSEARGQKFTKARIL